MTDRSKAYWVGLLFLTVIVLIGVFGWLMGAVGPFRRSVHFTVLYSFAGGVDIGSPVRVSGIKAGKVNSIEFLPEPEKREDRATVKVGIVVSKLAATHVRADSRFYINMAGVIGERYIEVSPGTEGAPVLPDNSVVRGVDPPRIDQLLSQGYGVFGRIQEFLEENEKTLTEFITNMTRLLADANRLLKGDDKRRLVALIENLATLFSEKNTDKLVVLIENLNGATVEAKKLAEGLQTEEARRLYKRLLDIVERAHEIDKASLKKFLQEEGVRARIF